MICRKDVQSERCLGHRLAGNALANLLPSCGRNPEGLEPMKKDDLVVPTDAAALLFGLLIFSVAIFWANRVFLIDPDTYWHIATGRWILLERAFPRHDIFSHTAAGEPWVNMEWLAQIMLALTYNWLGWGGLILLCGLLIALTFVLMYALLARELHATVALGATATSLLFASNHFLARPHLLTFPIIVVWTACLARATEESRRPSLWLLPLMVLWANLHGGFTLGLFLTAGFGLEATVAASSAERRRVASKWLSFWVGALLAGCVTPYGYHYLLQTIHVLNLGGVLRAIGELRPMNPYTELRQEVILLCLMGMGLFFGVKIGLVRVVMIFVLLHLALQHVRGLAIFALVLPLMIAHPLRQQFPFLRPSTDPLPLFDIRRLRPLLTTIALMATFVMTGLLGAAYMMSRPLDAPPEFRAPAAALNYAIKAKVTGPVFNDYDFGGYLIFRGIPTFIDGRTLPFGKDFALNYFEATREVTRLERGIQLEKMLRAPAGDKLDQLVDGYKVTWTLLQPRSAAALHFDRSPSWRRIYTDGIAVVHVRN
jgi:hypothetical protein